ncbi:MAG: hypothetical protein ABIR33_06565 [Pyrinomonadaceae bacterium]
MKKLLSVVALSLSVIFAAMPAQAKTSEYDLIVRHLKAKYKAKKINIPFMWLARFAVSVSRPAGVKSFSITLFKDLKFSYSELDKEMQAAMRNSFGPAWIPAVRVRTRKGQQVYMYMREDGNVVKIALVTIDNQEAAIIQATFSPDRLADFINNPKILGIKLADDPAPVPETKNLQEPLAVGPKKEN